MYVYCKECGRGSEHGRWHSAFCSTTGLGPRPSASPGPCPCACNSGGFCGGCGHAGCGGRR